MRKVNYNPLLMMLWNLEPNTLAIGNFTRWDNNEDSLIAKAKEVSNNNVAIMNLVTWEQANNAIFTTDAIELRSEEMELDYFINYSMNKNFAENFGQKDIWKSIKNNLNVKKIIINEEYFVGDEKVDNELLKEIFGEENIYLIEKDNSSKEIDQLVDILKTGKVKEYEKITHVNFSMFGHVGSGKQVGRIIGYPTANLNVDNNFPLKEGVYFTNVLLPNEQEFRNAMTCYWTNNDGNKVVETYIFDFEKDIYGWGIKIDFIDFVRDNKPVKDLDELKELLNNDAKEIRSKYIGG